MLNLLVTKLGFNTPERRDVCFGGFETNLLCVLLIPCVRCLREQRGLFIFRGVELLPQPLGVTVVEVVAAGVVGIAGLVAAVLP